MTSAEISAPERLSFTGPYQHAWDSTSLTTYKECPRKYQYSILQGYAPRAESVHLTFGILYHKALERYDYHRVADFSHDEAQIIMVKEMMVLSSDFKSDDKIKNRFNLIRSIVWYTEQFKDDPAKTVILANGKPAVELSFRFELPLKSATGRPYLYSGHLDRLAVFMGETYVFDRKTSKQTIYSGYFDKFSPNNQMSGYYFAGKIVFAQPIKGIVIDAAQIAVGFTRFERGMTPRTDDQLDEWVDNAAFYVAQAEMNARHGHWPMNESACGNYGGCQFRSICSKTPRLRQTWLSADFVQRWWDPLAVRGDI